LVVALADAFKMETCLVFCRTNLDCDNLELFLTSCGGGRKFAGKAESGKENPYSCVVLAGMRSQEERNRNLA
ncbi:putative ATP-dependent RNA helicase DDX1, partial [Toxoplasma gondii TgCatPRC2]